MRVAWKMDDLRSWWEVPSIAHFCSLFRNAFDLTDFDIEDLEEALLDSEREGGNDFVIELLSKLLNGCYSRKDISAANYDLYVKDVIKYKWEGVDSPIHQKSTFSELTLREKVELIHAVCEYRLDAEDVAELLKGFDGDNMRVEPLGKDKDGGTYWYFYGSRLYKEDPLPKLEITKEEKRALEKKKRQEAQKKKKEEKVKKKQEKKKQKAVKTQSKKKALAEKLKKEEQTRAANIRRSGRIKIKKLEEAEIDSESPESSSSSSTEEEESEESSSEEEEEVVSEAEAKQGKRGGKKAKTPARNKTPTRKGKQQNKVTSKSTTKKQPARGRRGSTTPKNQRAPEVPTAQTDPGTRRSSRIQKKVVKPPPPPKFDSDTEEEDDIDDIDSGHESAESDDDKSVMSGVSRYSAASSMVKEAGSQQTRKVPMSKISLNREFEKAAEGGNDEDDDDVTDNDEDVRKKEVKESDDDETPTKADVGALDDSAEVDDEDIRTEAKPDTEVTESTEKEINSKQANGHKNQESDDNDTAENSSEKADVTKKSDEPVSQIPNGETNTTEENATPEQDVEVKKESEQAKEDMDIGGNDGNCKEEDIKDESKPDVSKTKSENESELASVSKDNENIDVAKTKQEAERMEEKMETEDVQTESKGEVKDIIKDSAIKTTADDHDMEDEKASADDKPEKVSTDDKSAIKTEEVEEKSDDIKPSSPVTLKPAGLGVTGELDLMKKSATEGVEEKTVDSKPGLPITAKPATEPKKSTTPTRWHLMCSTLDDWVNLAEWFRESTVRCEKSLSKLITEDFLPVLPEIIEAREKERRKRLQELEVRRSDRITYKQREKMEQDKILAEALADEEREKIRAEEERRLKEEEHRLEEENRLREERARAREDRANRLSMREERARLIAEGQEIPPELIYTGGTQKYKDDEIDSDDSRCDLKDDEDYKNLMKVINAMKIHKDCWPFLEPVTEEQAPGYSDVIKRPMDMSKIERKVETREYRSSSHFLSDFKLMFVNCKRFNGQDSEFTECARSMERMLKKYTKKFMTDESTDTYSYDKDFTMSVRAGSAEKRYRPRRAASSRALQTVQKALGSDEEESSEEEGPPQKKHREFPAKTLSHQSQLLQEMIEMKRQREQRLAAGSLHNQQIIVRGAERVCVPNPAGGRVMIMPKKELPPTGVLRMAATREIKRKVDPQIYSPDGVRRDPGLSVIDSRRPGAKPPKTIRIVAASPTLSGQASVKETAESVKVSSDGYLIIGGKNSGIKVSENTKIVIQPPAPPGGTPGGSPANMAMTKEIFIKRIPPHSASPQVATSSTVTASIQPNTSSNQGSVSQSGNAQVLPKPHAIITASSNIGAQEQTTPSTQPAHHQITNKAMTHQVLQNPNPASPDFQKKQVDIAQRIVMLNQQKRKIMQQNLQGSQNGQALQGTPKIMRLDPAGAGPSQTPVQGPSHQSIEDRLRDPSLDNQLGAVTQDVVSSVNIASDILDSYYSVMNQGSSKEPGHSSIPSVVPSVVPAVAEAPETNVYVNETVSNSLRHKLLTQPLVGKQQLKQRQEQRQAAKVMAAKAMANGPSSEQHIPQTVSSHVLQETTSPLRNSACLNNTAQIVSVSPNQAGLGLPVAGSQNQTDLGVPAAGSLTHTVGSIGNFGSPSPLVSSGNYGNSALNTSVSTVYNHDGHMSIQTVLNSTRNLTGGKVQINIPEVVTPSAASIAFTLPQQSVSTVASVSLPNLPFLNAAISQPGAIDNTLSPIEALFAGQPTIQSIPVPVNPTNNSTMMHIPSVVTDTSPSKSRTNLFDMFESNQSVPGSIQASNSVEPGLSNPVARPGGAELGQEVRAGVKMAGVQNHPQGTVNFGSPLRTLSVMEALKSKLNPAKVNQSQDMTSPEVQQSVPKFCNRDLLIDFNTVELANPSPIHTDPRSTPDVAAHTVNSTLESHINTDAVDRTLESHPDAVDSSLESHPSSLESHPTSLESTSLESHPTSLESTNLESHPTSLESTSLESHPTSLESTSLESHPDTDAVETSLESHLATYRDTVDSTLDITAACPEPIDSTYHIVNDKNVDITTMMFDSRVKHDPDDEIHLTASGRHILPDSIYPNMGAPRPRVKVTLLGTDIIISENETDHELDDDAEENEITEDMLDVDNKDSDSDVVVEVENGLDHDPDSCSGDIKVVKPSDYFLMDQTAGVTDVNNLQEASIPTRTRQHYMLNEYDSWGMQKTPIGRRPTPYNKRYVVDQTKQKQTTGSFERSNQELQDFQFVESWTELQKLKKTSASVEDVANITSSSKTQRIYFKMSDAVPVSSLSSAFATKKYYKTKRTIDQNAETRVSVTSCRVPEIRVSENAVQGQERVNANPRQQSGFCQQSCCVPVFHSPSAMGPKSRGRPSKYTPRKRSRSLDHIAVLKLAKNHTHNFTEYLVKNDVNKRSAFVFQPSQVQDPDTELETYRIGDPEVKREVPGPKQLYAYPVGLRLAPATHTREMPQEAGKDREGRVPVARSSDLWGLGSMRLNQKVKRLAPRPAYMLPSLVKNHEPLEHQIHQIQQEEQIAEDPTCFRVRSTQSDGCLVRRRGRGRPRKSGVSVDETELGSPQSDGCLVRRRGRGRPRKSGVSIDETELGSPQSDECLVRRRGRGRPRLSHVSVDETELETDQAVQSLLAANNKTLPNELDNSLNCDEDFFTSNLIHNLFPANTNLGDGDFEIDHDFENIKTEILELHDKYLGHGNANPQGLPTGLVNMGESQMLNGYGISDDTLNGHCDDSTDQSSSPAGTLDIKPSLGDDVSIYNQQNSDHSIQTILTGQDYGSVVTVLSGGQEMSEN